VRLEFGYKPDMVNKRDILRYSTLYMYMLLLLPWIYRTPSCVHIVWTINESRSYMYTCVCVVWKWIIELHVYNSTHWTQIQISVTSKELMKVKLPILNTDLWASGLFSYRSHVSHHSAWLATLYSG